MRRSAAPPPDAMTAHPETAPYLDAFRARKATEPSWLAARREAALDRFAALGFPSRRAEAWRFTDLRPLERSPFLPRAGGAAHADLARLLQSLAFAPPHPPAARVPPSPPQGGGEGRGEVGHRTTPAHRIVLVDGRFSRALSAVGELPAGAFVGALSDALQSAPHLVEAAFDPAIDGAAAAQPFAALNAAFMSDGLVLALPPGAILDRPVELIHLGRGEAASFHLRHAVLMGEGSAAMLVETYAGGGAHWTNAVSVLRLGRGAELSHAMIEDEGSALHLGLASAVLEDRARYRGFLLTIGGRLARRDVFVRFAGAAGECQLDGASLLDGERESTIATFIDHAAPRCTTRELFKSVLDGRAHGAFLGSIAVRPAGQQTDAQQVSRNLLLSPRASVDTKPELEILADDVKCSHGATVGDLDPDQLFYLRSRGFAEDEARRLLVEAFLNEAVDRVGDQALREHVAAHLSRALAASMGGTPHPNPPPQGGRGSSSRVVPSPLEGEGQGGGPRP
jgi:Fe-S cluster assembly protein SufD